MIRGNLKRKFECSAVQWNCIVFIQGIVEDKVRCKK